MRERLTDFAAEREYLARVILDGGETLDRAPVAPETFASTRLRTFLDALVALHDRGAEVDTLGLRSELARRGVVGADDELLALTNTIPTHDGVRLRQRLEALHRDRQIVRALEDARAAMLGGEGDAAITALEDRLDALRRRDEGEAYTTGAEAAARAFIASEERRNGGQRIRIPTGIPAIDVDAGGLQPGDLLVVGGDTSVGKSSVALMMAMHAAARGETPGIVSCEDPDPRWGERILAITAGVQVQLIRNAAWNDQQGRTLRFGLGRAVQHPIHLAYAIGEPADLVLERARHLIRKRGCTVVILDYVQAVEVPRVSDPTEQVRLVTSRFKREINRPGVRAAGVVLSQMRKRDDEHEAPRRADLYFGQRLAQAAELITLLWKDKHGFVRGVLDKSKDSATGVQFVLERDEKTGMLVDPERGPR